MIDDVSKHVQESTFINGLKPEIRAEVRMMKPTGLIEVMKFAQSVEEGMHTAYTITVTHGWAAQHTWVQPIP